MKAIINKKHEKAFILGIEAFKKGIEMPARDKELLKMLKNKENGESTEMLIMWHKGYDTCKLAIEIQEKKECIYANDQFGTRVCGLECLPVQLEKCKNCKERAEAKQDK